MTARPSLPSLKALLGPAHQEQDAINPVSPTVASPRKNDSHDNALSRDTPGDQPAAQETRQSGHLRGGNGITQETHAKLASEVMAPSLSKIEPTKEQKTAVLPLLPVLQGEQPIDSSYGLLPVEQPNVYAPTYTSHSTRPYASSLPLVPPHAESAPPTMTTSGPPPLPPSHSHRAEIPGPHHRSTFPPRPYAPDMHGYYPPNPAMYHYPPAPDRSTSLHAPFPPGYAEPAMNPYHHRLTPGEIYPYDPYRMPYPMHETVEDSLHYPHGRVPPPIVSTTRYYPHRPPSPQKERKKRPRRKFQEIERLYACDFPNCQKAYGTLNHLNAHITMQGHGARKTHHEFRHLPQHQRTAGRTSITIKSSDATQDVNSADNSDVASGATTPADAGETPTGSPDSSVLDSSASFSAPLQSATGAAPVSRKRKATEEAGTAADAVTHSRPTSAGATSKSH